MRFGGRIRIDAFSVALGLSVRRDDVAQSNISIDWKILGNYILSRYFSMLYPCGLHAEIPAEEEGDLRVSPFNDTPAPFLLGRLGNSSSDRLPLPVPQ